ncbi:hypothetical protein ES706_00728 [subsurface metagenome]|nr:CPBP family intramembrane metalloprotease [Hadesarchaea archaeon]
MIWLLWLDLAKILAAGVVLGLVVGKLVVLRPSYLERIRPRHWLPVARRMRRRESIRLISIALAFTAAALVVAIVAGNILHGAGVELYSREEYPFTALQEQYPLLLLVIVNVLPIFEEWIFRGILLEEVARRTRSKWIGVMVSALIFAAFHLSNPGTYPAFAIPLLGAGLLLGICYLVSGLAGAIITHNAYNSILVVLWAIGV